MPRVCLDIVDMYRGISPILKDCFLPKKLGKIQKKTRTFAQTKERNI